MISKHSLYRLLHRDLGYFYLGLILCFSISGIALNHRDVFNAHTYVIGHRTIQLELTDSLSMGSESYLRSISTQISDRDFLGLSVHGNGARMYFKNTFAFVDLETGKAEVESFKTRPVLGHMAALHKSMNKWWVWFSDIFAIALIIISITGVLLSKGKYSFKRRGWLLTCGGLLFPIIVLFLLS